MKILILILISFIVTLPTESVREEIKKRRRERDQPIIDCILNNETSSEELKNRIKDNPDKDLIKLLSPREYKYEKNDRDVIRYCRKQFLDKLREKHRERRNSHPSNNDL